MFLLLFAEQLLNRTTIQTYPINWAGSSRETTRNEFFRFYRESFSVEITIDLEDKLFEILACQTKHNYNFICD